MHVLLQLIGKMYDLEGLFMALNKQSTSSYFYFSVLNVSTIT